MNNQTSIKYITALLENPQTITDGDQSSIALFRQTFPYFIPARYLGALESHKKSPYTPKMLTSIQPYLGDWIRFCEFLEAGNKAVGELASVNKVTDKKKVDIQPEPEVLVSPIPAVKEEQKQPEPAAPVVVPEEVTPVQPEIIVDNIPPVQQIVVAEEEIISVLPEAIVPPTPVVPEIEVEPEVSIPVPPVAETLTEVISEHAWPKDKDAAPVFMPPAPEVVVAKEEPPIFDMPVAFVIEAPEPQQPAWPVTQQAEAPSAPQEAPAVISVPVETAFSSIPLAPVPVVISDDDVALPEYETEVINEPVAPETEVEIVQAEALPETDVVIFPEDPATLPDATREAVEESDFAKAWAEMESQVEEPVAAVPDTIRIMDEDEPAVSVTETDDEVDHDPLIFPIYTKDYFLQQGEKVSEEIPLEISELKDAEEMSEEDKSLMVVMSFSEWLLHFKSTSEKQKEETKDQKALKTMWQKEKLAAAMEEENEEIPETVFEMAVNSISKEEGLVSESLADIYIKQGKYDKAMEMYRKLSLRNPQKSAYFARKIEEALKDKQS
jgi:hypothetical protein